jgi:type IV pilus assembly protein PilV
VKSLRDICRGRGFSLLEVLVALVVLSVGLLGIAKMQALALSSTTVASSRSLAAIEASSLADAMHANRAYWTSSSPVGTPITVAGTTVSSGPSAATSCATACTAAGLAGYDLQQWANALSALLPNDQATITCQGTTPVSCTIQITWSEKTVAINAQEQAQLSASGSVDINNPQYTLYVEP